MKLKIVIYADDVHWSGGAAINVPDIMTEAFEPIGVCDYPQMVCVTGEIVSGSLNLQRKINVFLQ